MRALRIAVKTKRLKKIKRNRNWAIKQRQMYWPLRSRCKLALHDDPNNVNSCEGDYIKWCPGCLVFPLSRSKASLILKLEMRGAVLINYAKKYRYNGHNRFAINNALKPGFHLRCKHNRLDYQLLFGKGARAPPPNSLLWEERWPDSRKRRKSSLIIRSPSCIEQFVIGQFVIGQFNKPITSTL